MEYQTANWPSKVCKERPLMTLDQPLSIIGLLTALYLLTRLAFHAHTYLRRSSLPHYLHPSTPTWALITGATDGIGLGFAQELCQRGFNVILHGRNPKKLQDAQAQLVREYPLAKTKTVVFDASHPADGLEQRVREWIGDTELSVLINNVGGQGGLTSKTYQTLEESTVPTTLRSEEDLTQSFLVTALFDPSFLRTLARQLNLHNLD
jgi:17beta-estradiol 17-dehydrogenase / very-long-chain 3-oxoacyl-CoA reductase